MTRAYTSECSAQDDVTYCWERGCVPPGLHLSPTTDAKTRPYGQVLIVGSVGEFSSSPPLHGGDVELMGRAKGGGHLQDGEVITNPFAALWQGVRLPASPSHEVCEVL